jgi:hypothetical protein
VTLDHQSGASQNRTLEFYRVKWFTLLTPLPGATDPTIVAPSTTKAFRLSRAWITDPAQLGSSCQE